MMFVKHLVGPALPVGTCYYLCLMQVCFQSKAMWRAYESTESIHVESLAAIERRQAS